MNTSDGMRATILARGNYALTAMRRLGNAKRMRFIAMMATARYAGIAGI